MQTVALMVLSAVWLSSAARSGPYLPSGWRPDGPAFNLPGEIKQSTEGTLRDVVQVEAEGSDYLREYGPPKVQEVSQDITVQALPDISTEEAFITINLDLETVDQRTVAEEKQAVVKEETVLEESDEIETHKEVEVEAQVEAENASNIDNAVSIDVRTREDTVEEVVTEGIVTGVQNIADALANLENEIKVKQIESNKDVAVLKSINGISESVDQVSDGFQEYGPPGFQEYGPPKSDDVARIEAIVPAETAAIIPEPVLETKINEVRRRRFSPKFRSSKRAH